ncbi:hypothetical protein FC56_GL001482 [Lentilactobacillus senioris DSM 24302 = JCM 17472]|uniref:GW domain-containing protein n=1 Tax=Lentilactobacillus senioris DSM 24302 = JCM 17472 TaxID=1423802 RepID=A0A0R2D2X9_9LACO|nr:GW dipeptide domain-containing protein [Lentilactobacillus senioris]KRM94524.1 hypothetical protein FC56_GL001482 [Lentilactobacillus senioris DSM 24302 = JCM 17472]
MNQKIKTTLLTTAAAMGLLVAGSLNASAKTYPIVTANNPARGGATTRNFVPTGSNALFTKAGTLKGAKLVASKATMAKLAESNKGQDYFFGYRVARTSNGYFYMKVVSFDKKYRGWIYVGKVNPQGAYQNTAGGLKLANTSKAAKMPSNTQVQLADPGTSHVIWNFPYMAQYGSKKLMKDTSDYANDTFTVTKSRRLTRGNTLYYKVVDNNDSDITGWIYYKGVTSDAAETEPSNPTSSNSVTVTFKDGTTGKTVGEKTLVDSSITAGSQPTYATKFVTTKIGNGNLVAGSLKSVMPGYDYEGLTTAQHKANGNAIIGAKYGSTITIFVSPNVAPKNGFLVTYFDLTKTAIVGKSAVVSSSSQTAKQLFASTFKDGGSVTVNGKKYTYKLADNRSISQDAKLGTSIAVNVRS